MFKSTFPLLESSRFSLPGANIVDLMFFLDGCCDKASLGGGVTDIPFVGKKVFVLVSWGGLYLSLFSVVCLRLSGGILTNLDF